MNDLETYRIKRAGRTVRIAARTDAQALIAKQLEERQRREQRRAKRAVRNGTRSGE
jgi:hypothetical protein